MDIRAHTFPCRMSVLSTLPPGGLECLFPHSGYPTVSSTRYHFCFNFCQSDRWQIKRHVASVCISLVSGEAKHLFLHLWAVWFLPAKNRHCPVLGKALLGISSPPPSPSRSTGSVPPPCPPLPRVSVHKQQSPASYKIGLPGRQGFCPQIPAASQRWD